MKKPFLKAVGLLATSLVFAAPALAEEPTQNAQNARQIEEYKKLVPPGNVPSDIESDVVKVRTARNWSLLTYPTGKMPATAMRDARDWVSGNVEDIDSWPGEGIRLGNSVDSRALVTPQLNVWTPVGPAPLDSTGTTNNAYRYGIVAGRVSAGGLAVDPSNTNVAYAGFVAGGLWKTTNLTAATPTWTPLWDDKDYVTQSAGAIEIDPNNSNVIYVGTGDWAASDQQSSGIMKSTDGGATWTLLGSDVFVPYSPTVPAGGNRWANQNTKVVQVDPNNSNKILVGTRYDLYISHDAGSSWQVCGFGNGYTNPAASNPTVAAINRISGIYLDTRSNPTKVYVAVGYAFENGNGNNGVYRFNMPASGCPAWPADFTAINGGFPANTGNGVNVENGGATTGRIELAGTTSSGQLTLYAQVENATKDNYSSLGTYVLRPDGGSTTWTKLTETYSQCNNAGTGQDWYDLFLGVDPTNDKVLYVGHLDVYKVAVNATYTAGTYTNMTDVYGTTCANYGRVHPDQHTIAFLGNTSSFIVGNDGGVYYNNTGTAAGFKQINNSFNTNQFYAGQIGRDFAGGGMGGTQWLFGGMQDNGNASWDSTSSNFQWTGRSIGGDGFFTTFDVLGGSLTAGQWMTEYTFGSLYASRTGADGPFSSCNLTYTGTADWSTPFQLDTLHCKSTTCSNYILGEDYVWASVSIKATGCPTWKKISGSQVKTAAGSILTTAMAPSDPKGVATGTSDGKVWMTSAAYSGTSCTQAAANTSTFSCSIANTLPTWVDADPTNAVLPNRAVLQVAFDPTNVNVVFAAVGGFDQNTPTTPGHLFQVTRSGSSATVANKTGNLPNVPASAVAVNPHNRKQVFVGTHFGFYYTNDIDAASPTWVRFQTGLPNTVIQYLTIDRGPASDPIKGTTLAAFTYGRGIYLLKLPTS